MKRFAISDIHGAYDALIQVLERCEFNSDEDQLIFLGDCVDGFESGITKSIEFLSNLPNKIIIRGNHDEWCQSMLGCKLGKTSYGLHSFEYRSWTEQGGQATLNSMNTHDSYELVYEFLSNAVDYYEDDNYNLFVHGGIEPKHRAVDCDSYMMHWDRSLIRTARLHSIETNPLCTEYDTVFIGHTPVVNYNRFEPTKWNNVMAIDCGASYPNYGGRLGIVNIDTMETWVSDPVKELYPNEKAR
jgi:serine/threonine protein phosphatase 1